MKSPFVILAHLAGEALFEGNTDGYRILWSAGRHVADEPSLDKSTVEEWLLRTEEPRLADHATVELLKTEERRMKAFERWYAKQTPRSSRPRRI